jgi:hypothetical protein
MRRGQMDSASGGRAPAGGADPRGAGRSWLADHLARRRWALIAVVVFAVVSMAFTLLWAPVVRHTSLWVVPGDLWSTFRVAHLVGWGDIGGIYDPSYGLLTFPGIVVILAPVAMLSGHFGLSESLGMWVVPHPGAWLLLGPAVLLLGSMCLVAFDAMAEELGVGRLKRFVLLGAESAIVFQVVTLWGHPEDMMAVGLATYALLMGARSRWSAAGWLWGGAVICQPLVLVLLPVALAVTPRGRRVQLVVRACLPTAVAMAGPLVSQWAMTTRALLHQENPLRLNHPTPWVAFSARLGPDAVSAGPGRMLALAAAVVLGWVAWRKQPTLLGLLWMGALALSLRCFFESVMVPFYLGPPFAVILVTCAAQPGRSRLGIATAAALCATVVAFHHMGEWAYWLAMVAFLATGLACAWPGSSAMGDRAPEASPVGVDLPVRDGTDAGRLRSR